MSGTSGMSQSDAVPTAVRTFIDATNAGDSERFVAVFTPDAMLSDWGKEFRGRDAIAGWDRTDNIGRGAEFELIGMKSGDTAQEVVATVVVSGGGFNGTSDLAFTLRGDEIARLVIAP